MARAEALFRRTANDNTNVVPFNAAWVKGLAFGLAPSAFVGAPREAPKLDGLSVRVISKRVQKTDA